MALIAHNWPLIDPNLLVIIGDYITGLNKIWSDEDVGVCYADESCKKAMPEGESYRLRAMYLPSKSFELPLFLGPFPTDAFPGAGTSAGPWTCFTSTSRRLCSLLRTSTNSGEYVAYA